jgi:hypothetical protein
VARVMNTTLPVLITGESGTGKSLIARAVHDFSDRRSLPFVVVGPADLQGADGPAQVLARARGGYPSPRRGRATCPRRRRPAWRGCSTTSGPAPPASWPPPAPTSRGASTQGDLPPGPLLPPQRRVPRRAAAPRARGRHPAPGRARARARRARGRARSGASAPARSTSCGLPLARQRPPARERAPPPRRHRV